MAESVQATHTRPARRGGKFWIAGTSNGCSCQNTSYSKIHYFPSHEEIRRQWIALYHIIQQQRQNIGKSH